MVWIGLAIFLGFASLGAAVLVVGMRWVDVQRADVLGEDPRQKHGPRHKKERREPDDDEDDLPDDAVDADVVDFVTSGPDALARMQMEEWREERRREGMSEREIDDVLKQREPLVII